MHITQVIEGLRNGQSFERRNDTDTETLRPAHSEHARHSVSSHTSLGGSGGSAEVPFHLIGERFEKEDWHQTN